MNHVCEILNIFVLLDKFFLPHLKRKFIVTELPVTFLSFGSLHLRVLSFNSEQYFYTLDFGAFNLR